MTRAERILLALLVLLVALSPVFLGGVGRFEQDWSGRSRTLLERFLRAEGPWNVLCLLSLAAAAASLLVARERAAAGEPPAFRLHARLLLPLGGLALLALLHLLPLPRPLLALLSPGAARELEVLLPGDRSWRPVSLSPEGTGVFLGGLGAGGAVLLGTLLAARRRGPALLLLGAVAGTYALVAAYGMAESFLGEDRVIGFGKVGAPGVTGTFLNRSHMAAGAALALPAALVLLFLAVRGGRWWVPAAAAAALLLGAVVPFTHSRMGLASAAVGVAALGLLAARASRWPWWGRAAVLLLAAAAVGGGVKAALDRVPDLRRRFELATTERGFFDIRFPAWKATVELAARHPLTGSGLGSYGTAIHGTQTPDNPDELHFAHSEPLQLLAEGGPAGLFLGVLLAAGALGAALAAAGSGDPLLRAAGCACGAGLAALLAGSTTEFHFHIPALGIAAAVLAGIPAGLAAGDPRAAPPPGGGARPALLAAGAVALGAVSLLQASGAASRLAEARFAEQGGDAPGWIAAARAAVAADPGSAGARRSLSGALAEGAWTGEDREGRAREALAEADRAVDLEPFHAYGHWARARALLAAGEEGEGVAALRRALSRAGGIGHLHFAAGKTLLLLSTRDPGLRGEALEALRYAGACEPRWFTAAVRALEEAGLPLRGHEALVPDRAYALVDWVEACRGAGDHEGAFAAAVRLWRFDPGPESRKILLDAARRAGREAEAEGILAGGR